MGLSPPHLRWGQLASAGIGVAMNASEHASIREVHGLLRSIEERMNERFDRLEERLGRLERWRAYTAGALAVAVFGVGLVLRLV